MEFDVFLDTTLGQVLRNLARVEQRRKIATHALARYFYLKAKEKALRVDAKQMRELSELDASIETEYRQLTDTIDTAFHTAAEISGCRLLGGVTVFFLPGTDAPVPICYGTWPLAPNLPYGEMDRRIELVAQLLRHNQVPWYGKDSAAAITANPLDSPMDHFFLWSMAHSKVVPFSTSDSADHGDCGYNQFTVWANPEARQRLPREQTRETGSDGRRVSELADPLFTLKVPIRADGTPGTVCVPWFCRAIYPPFVGSPVFINHNSFVLTASFFDGETWSQLRQDPARFHLMIRRHTVLSQVVVLPLYSFILREAQHNLRDALQRRIVSESLLNSLAHRLHTDADSSPASPSVTVFTCADLRSHIYDDLWRSPDNVYGSVLRIQRSMYQRLHREGARLNAHPASSDAPPPSVLTYAWSLDDEDATGLLGTNHCGSRAVPPSWIDYLPTRSPLTDLLLEMETAQRAFRTSHRDHVVHQFQVFLQGLLLLNSFLPAFRQAFRSSLCQSEYLSGRLEWARTDTDIDYLLRLTWFLAATFHDMGYPVQLIDDTIDNLRTQIAKLFNDDDRILLSKQSVSSLLLEPMFHTNPRLDILWDEVIRAFRDNVDSGVLSAEAWRYFLSFMAFHNKDHPFGSVLTLGLSWLDNSERFKNVPTGWTTDGLHRLLNWHVLVPIMVHHASSWGRVANGMADFKKHHLMNAMQIKQETLTGQTLFSFSKQPIAALLAFCDAVQEAGRPSGRTLGEQHAEEERTPNVAPKVTDEYRECPYVPGVQCVVLRLQYASVDSQDAVLDHFRGKRSEIAAVYTLYADADAFMGKVCVIVHGWDSSDQWIETSGQVRRPSLATECKAKDNCELCKQPSR